MTPRITFIIAILSVTFTFAQTPDPAQPTNATAILRAAKTVFIYPKSDYMNREALERELVKHPDFNQLGLLVVRNEIEADLILEVYRKKWTTRFTITAMDRRSLALVSSCQESSIGGDVEPKLAKCFIKQAKAARAQAAPPVPASAEPQAVQQKDAPDQKKGSPDSWVDPATGLMWAGKDNGQEEKWYKANRYCRNLRLGGYADWRLATIEELEGLYDSTAAAPGLGAGKDGKRSWQLHVKGNLLLSGRQWSSTQTIDHYTGGLSGFVWYYDFWNKFKDKHDASFLGDFHYALCVRSTGVQSASAMTPISQQKKDPPETWVDSVTGLMWAGQDNGRDVKWPIATKYCSDLRLGGYADWRLGTLEELEGIYDETASVPGLGGGKDGKGAMTWHVNGNLFLTGRQWSSSKKSEKTLGEYTVWFFDFSDEYKRKNDSPWLYASAAQRMRALCVRSSEK
jgi:Protein of unknown function (DUF1566)